MPDDTIFEKSEKLKELVDELSKTAVLSDNFKDKIVQLAAGAVYAAATSGESITEKETLRQEFIDRRFKDKASVRLKVHSIFEMCSKENSVRFSIYVFRYVAAKFPNGDGLRVLLSSSQQEVEALREWLWRELNDNIEEFVTLTGFRV